MEFIQITGNGDTIYIEVSDSVIFRSSGPLGRFKIGDGGANTPLAKASSFILNGLIGKTINDFTIFRNGTAIWPVDDYAFDGTSGRVSLAIEDDEFTNGETFLIL